MTGDARSETRNEANSDTERRVDRAFTCTLCGYEETHEVTELQAAVRSTCLNCGDWTVQTADVDALVDAARDVAERLAGPVLTERQALAYLLREVVGLERRDAAEAMDASASNVDNLHRRGREKVADARRVTEYLQAL